MVLSFLELIITLVYGFSTEQRLISLATKPGPPGRGLEKIISTKLSINVN